MLRDWSRIDDFHGDESSDNIYRERWGRGIMEGCIRVQ